MDFDSFSNNRVQQDAVNVMDGNEVGRNEAVVEVMLDNVIVNDQVADIVMVDGNQLFLYELGSFNSDDDSILNNSEAEQLAGQLINFRDNFCFCCLEVKLKNSRLEF
jgi:hypothetical protein